LIRLLELVRYFYSWTSKLEDIIEKKILELKLDVCIIKYKYDKNKHNKIIKTDVSYLRRTLSKYSKYAKIPY